MNHNYRQDDDKIVGSKKKLKDFIFYFPSSRYWTLMIVKSPRGIGWDSGPIICYKFIVLLSNSGFPEGPVGSPGIRSPFQFEENLLIIRTDFWSTIMECRGLWSTKNFHRSFSKDLLEDFKRYVLGSPGIRSPFQFEENLLIRTDF